MAAVSEASVTARLVVRKLRPNCHGQSTLITPTEKMWRAIALRRVPLMRSSSRHSFQATVRTSSIGFVGEQGNKHFFQRRRISPYFFHFSAAVHQRRNDRRCACAALLVDDEVAVAEGVTFDIRHCRQQIISTIEFLSDNFDLFAAAGGAQLVRVSCRNQLTVRDDTN